MLVQDRVKLPPEVMEAIKEEIIAVISKYVDMDKEGLEVTLTTGENMDKFTANIPVRRRAPRLLGPQRCGHTYRCAGART